MNGKVCYDILNMGVSFVNNQIDLNKYVIYIELNPVIKDYDIIITNLRLVANNSPLNMFWHGIRYRMYYINCVWV